MRRAERMTSETKTGEPGTAPRSAMRASVLCDVGRLEVRDVPLPAVGARDVLVRVRAVDLCGTDLHIFAGHANYHADELGRVVPLRTAPQILGHEITGVVERVGEDVTDLRPGERVCIDQGLNCFSRGRASLCEYCATGDSHQCEHYGEHGITGLPGGLAEFICVPATNAVRVGGDLSDAEAAMTEPLACVLHAAEAARRATARFRLQADDHARRVSTTLVCGAGPAGLLFVQALRRVLGFDGRLIVSEPNERKRRSAEDFGAEVIDPSACDLAEEVRDRTGGRGVELLIEASGSGRVFSVIPRLVRKQATVLLYGHGHAGVDLSVLNDVMFKEPTLVTPVGASGGFDERGRPVAYLRALALLEERTIDVRRVVTHRYGDLSDVARAFTEDYHKPDYIKGVVAFG